MSVRAEPRFQEEEIKSILSEFKGRCLSKSDYLGLVVISNQAEGSSRIADEFSDVDLELYISIPAVEKMRAGSFRELIDSVQGSLPVWLPEFDFIAPVLDGLEINVRQRIIEYDELLHTRWSESRREAYSSGYQLLHDPSGRIETVIANKLRWYPLECEAQVARHISRAVWDADSAKVQSNRQDYLAAHSLINSSIDCLLMTAFYLQPTFPPVRKWLWSLVREIDIFQENDLNNLGAALVITQLNEASINHRLSLIAPLLDRLYSDATSTLQMDPCDYFNSRVSTDRQLAHMYSGDPENWGFRSQSRGYSCWNLKGRPVG